MSRTPNFPGMNPYLESPTYWPEIHTWLIVEIARHLNPQLQPKYRAAVETRVYVDATPTAALVGIPDTTLYQKDHPASEKADSVINESHESSVATVTKPERVTLPMPYEVTERYLEIKDLSSKRVIAVLELLSPANKRPGEGRKKYLAKRQTVLASATHFIEIDLLRKGDTMPIAGARAADYHILVSRSQERPSAEYYPFNLQETIPKFLVPLTSGDKEPVLDLKQLITSVCADTAIDSDIDYAHQPQPSLEQKDFDWIQTL